ncbi:uncharacterized protein LOC117340408 [Pecten maximus]|uniref:uncharacterized protein LOC117340408 n=1 Tax=Pecten maximus TaxID=6579 RepID=UPI001457F434|nr:uncharacterized protein LOC117340408 [Pecten maximus]
MSSSMAVLKTSLEYNEQCQYRVLKYVVARKDYGRLDYNARIAQRIHKYLDNTDLQVPDIIIYDHVSFMAIVPTARAFDHLNDDEQIIDITEDIMTEPPVEKKEMNRWISLCLTYVASIEIPKKDKVFCPAETQVENLKKDSHVKRFLTTSFENEIFAYAEQAFKYVRSRLEEKTEEQEKLEMVDLEIRSLLVRKLPEHDTSAFCTPDDQIDKNSFLFHSSRNIKEKLENKSLQGCGVRGFCNTVDGILVFVVQPEECTDRTDITNRIGECLGEEKAEVVWVESIKTSDLAVNGDRLTKKTSKDWGTLGCYGRKNDNTLVAITAGHCASTGDTLQITKYNSLLDFGDCTESYDQQDVDIAIIKIKSDMIIHCRKNFHNENGDVCEVSVYQKDELTNWPVHKIGAATGHISGIVYSGVARVCNETGVVISGNSDNEVFSEPGDSGSIVFFYDPTDVDNRRVNLLSIVSKQIGIRGSGTIPIGLSRKPTLTRRLDRGLKKAGDIRI